MFNKVAVIYHLQKKGNQRQGHPEQRSPNTIEVYVVNILVLLLNYHCKSQPRENLLEEPPIYKE